MLTLIRPSPPLRAYVDCYVYVRDIVGARRGFPIRTAPRPGGVLTVNLGRPNRTSDGAATPILSLLGVQTRARGWCSDADSHFVMALLTPIGLTCFAPGSGADVAGNLLDLDSVIGERAASGLLSVVNAHSDGLGEALDSWLLARLFREAEKPEMRLTQAACIVLSESERIDVAAHRIGISRRHVTRIISRHLGIGPKTLIDLYRLNRSLRALQSGLADGIDGFADQAHQNRVWRQQLGVTPGRYAREGRSALAEAFDPTTDRTAFYL